MAENTDSRLENEATAPNEQSAPQPSLPPQQSQPATAEKMLNTLAKIILTIGILVALVTFINAYRVHTSNESIIFLFYTSVVVFFTLLTWSIIKVFLLIAQRLREK